ncbi:MAG: cyclic 2,3-diphosphoglycerate synthase [Syntrophorhabdales bacterium]
MGEEAKGRAVEKVVIMGAAGRDFHNFNVYFRGNQRYNVVAFTAAPQIPVGEGRLYPPALSGRMYPEGIPIYPEGQLGRLISESAVDLVVFSYSDIAYVDLMHRASRATTEGADFILLGASYTMLPSKKPVVSVCAVRTGAGKSQTTRKVCAIIRENFKKTFVVVRHPMPYGDLGRQTVQRFASYEDFDRHNCTIEEREEYEPLVGNGIVVYAGVDYGLILERAEKEADIIVWDGGNNDTPFYRPDIHIVLFDPHRPGHELLYYPGEDNMRMADIAVINKVDSAVWDNVERVRTNIRRYAPAADIILAESPILLAHPELISGSRVLVVEDGPTLTHGGMSYGAGYVAAMQFGAGEMVDPRPYAVGTIRDTFEAYPHIGPVLPAVGYSASQIRDLEMTINRAPCDLVVFATPIQLNRLLSIDKPALPVRYEYKDHGQPTLESILVRRISALFSARAQSTAG